MSRFDSNPLWPAIGIIAAAAPVSVSIAATYLTVEAAQKAMFPSADSFVPIVLTLTDAEKRAVAEAAGPQAPHGELRTWVAKRGNAVLGHVFVDNVIGREDFITYAVGVGADGKLLPVEILDYRESHGGEIRNKAWLAQFAGRSDPNRVADAQGHQEHRGRDAVVRARDRRRAAHPCALVRRAAAGTR